MQFATIFRITGVLLMIFSLSMLPPLLVNAIYQEATARSFLISFAVTFLSGFIAWLIFRENKNDLKTRDGFVVVVLFWTVLCIFGALPFIISPHPQVTFTDAIFESVSGLTTTGATVLRGLEQLPYSILYYRQQLHFLGGMGIIVLAVAILPMLGIGGMQLYRAEIPGPIKDTKLTPRIAETAKALWYIYVALSVICTLAYWAAGMTFLDALGESFSTVATGGFSMHDNSFAYYNNSLIEIIGVVFMILGATNFALHFVVLQRQTLMPYWVDVEFKAYMLFLLAGVLLTTFTLLLYGIYHSPTQGFIKSLFNVISIGTTTGLSSAPFALWPTFIPILLMLIGMVGGCAASTSGGIKVIRILLLFKQGSREMRRLMHPKAVMTLKFGKQILSENVIQAIWGFIAVFIALFTLLLLLLMAEGHSFMSAFGAVAACLPNVGAGIGAAAADFAKLNNESKWILTFAMLAGRLEIFTVLILFTPAFWRG